MEKKWFITSQSLTDWKEFNLTDALLTYRDFCSAVFHLELIQLRPEHKAPNMFFFSARYAALQHVRLRFDWIQRICDQYGCVIFYLWETGPFQAYFRSRGRQDDLKEKQLLKSCFGLNKNFKLTTVCSNLEFVSDSHYHEGKVSTVQRKSKSVFTFRLFLYEGEREKLGTLENFLDSCRIFHNEI